MCADEKDLEEIWKEMKAATFDQFIKEHIGYNTETDDPFTPGCYGSGNGKDYCDECKYQPTC